MNEDALRSVREVRTSRGISQGSLAHHLQVDPRRLCDYESGRRRWPAELLPKVYQFLKQAHQLPPEMFLSLSHQHRLGGVNRWQTKPESCTTWAGATPAYEDLYRKLDLGKLPPLAFRRQVRCDALQEPLSWTQLFVHGAEAVMASPNALGCAPYPPVDSQGLSLGMTQRPAFWMPKKYLLFPQLSIIANQRILRPDGMLLNLAGTRKPWIRLELDGGAHQNAEWDARRDQQLLIDTLRFSSEVILGLRFAQELQASLDSLSRLSA
ncbi:MAG: helix-turn-helix transcriptional regulator [Candidatus Eremiobacteraeota bacterium]|nr:helix-turn-helix transcriptional regulator [Candidatus Eremiobacteraeota bacterium]MCW5871279.1 helix-turn-helix transcriptional regulator [Candidatus Eremiobacteraeota bacterium]